MGKMTARTRRGGRYPRGYGLPSLVVVLFFVSVLVSTIVEAVGRETVEARAAAAMNAVEERLHAFEVTGEDGTAILPHLVASRDVTVTLLPGSGGPPEAVIEDQFRSAAEAALFEQQLRVFLNLPAGVQIGPITPGDLRRQYPERVLRSGDRMGASIGMNGDPAAPASIENVGVARSGTGLVSGSGTADGVIAWGGNLIEGSLLEADLVSGSTLELTGTAASDVVSVSVSGAIVAAQLGSGSVESKGFFRAASADIRETRVLGPFAADVIDVGEAPISFDRITVNALRAGRVRTNAIQAQGWFGGDPGQLGGGIPPVDPDQVLGGDR